MNTIIDIYNNILTYGTTKIEYVIDVDNKIWFKFLKIAKLLNYKSRKDALRDHIFKENKKKIKEIKSINKNDDHPNTIYINESGLYTFLIKSKMKKAIDFQLWLVNEVLPNLRKHGKYQLNKKTKLKLNKLNTKIKILEKNNKILTKNMTKNKYPLGIHIYVIEDDGLYKIGHTKNLKNRMNTYNTGKANKAEYKYYKKTKCAKEIELCMKAMLNKYIYKSNKEFYKCSLKKILDALSKCLKIEKNCNKCSEINQNGGNITTQLISLYKQKYKNIIDIHTNR